MENIQLVNIRFRYHKTKTSFGFGATEGKDVSNHPDQHVSVVRCPSPVPHWYPLSAVRAPACFQYMMLLAVMAPLGRGAVWVSQRFHIVASHFMGLIFEFRQPPLASKWRITVFRELASQGG